MWPTLANMAIPLVALWIPLFYWVCPTFIASDEGLRAIEWKPVTGRSITTILNKCTRLTTNSYVVKGANIIITQNIKVSSNTLIPNGAIAQVLSWDGESIEVNLISPLEAKSVR